MASGKYNYFRHSFNARNDEFVIGLINEFKEKGYFMWFALTEICAEMVCDGHSQPLKINQSRLYRELRCNQRTLNLFLTYCEGRSKVHSTYIKPTYDLEIPSLLKFVGKYSEKSPNKIKENEIKENKIKVIKSTKSITQKNPKVSPLASLFKPDDPIQEWLLTGSEISQKELLIAHSHHVLAEEVKKAFLWQCEKKPRKAGTFLLTWMSNKKSHAYNPNQAQERFKNKTNTVVATPQNPTGNPYLQEAIEKGYIA
jgi:hypothetical protein